MHQSARSSSAAQSPSWRRSARAGRRLKRRGYLVQLGGQQARADECVGDRGEALRSNSGEAPSGLPPPPDDSRSAGCDIAQHGRGQVGRDDWGRGRQRSAQVHLLKLRSQTPFASALARAASIAAGSWS